MPRDVEVGARDFLDLDGYEIIEPSREVTPRYEEEARIVKSSYLARRYLEEEGRLTRQAVGILADTHFGSKVTHRVATDRTVNLLSDIDDEVQFRQSDKFYRRVDKDLENGLLRICKLAENGMVNALETYGTTRRALTYQEPETYEEVVEERKLTRGERLRGRAIITYHRPVRR